MKFLYAIIVVLCSTSSYTQCLNQVTHLSGVAIVNNTQVTVSSFGMVDTLLNYCPSITSPYVIGSDGTLTNLNGSYSFQFSPPIDSLSLNFSGIDYTSSQEIVKLYVNGIHYSISSPGSFNNCDSMAILTPAGNITGCFNCGVSGWINTFIQGPISSITVLDSIVTGSPNGAVFSLFICDGSTTSILKNNVKKANIHPNPTTEKITISLEEAITGILTIRNSLGQLVFSDKINGKEHQVQLDVPIGIYFLRIESNGELITKKIIKQ